MWRHGDCGHRLVREMRQSGTMVFQGVDVEEGVRDAEIGPGLMREMLRRGYQLRVVPADLLRF